jgi:VanZ family protein
MTGEETSKKSAAVPFFRYRLPPLLYCALIFWQSSIPVPEDLLPSIPFLDKILHAVGYALLGWLTARALDHGFNGLDHGRLFWLATLLAALYGLSDEFHQSFVPGRTPDPADFLADALGGAAGALTWVGYFGRTARKPGGP